MISCALYRCERRNFEDVWPDTLAECVYPCDASSKRSPFNFWRDEVRFDISRPALLTLSFTCLCLAQKDPGVRGGPAGAGGPIPGLTDNELALFKEGKLRTTQLESVCDDCSDVTLGSDTGQDPNLANSDEFIGTGRPIQRRPVLGLPSAAGDRRIGRLPGAESARSAEQVPEARKPDVRSDSASQGRTESGAIVHHAVWTDPRSPVSKKAGRNAGRRRARTVHHCRTERHRRARGAPPRFSHIRISKPSIARATCRSASRCKLLAWD